MKKSNDEGKPSRGYYVYILIDSRSDTPFYIGKGCAGRLKEHEREAKRGHKCHKCNKIRSIWKSGGTIKSKIAFTTLDEQEAYRVEAKLIEELGLINLTNVKPGGERLEEVQTLGANKPPGLMNEVEYRAYLRRMPKMSAKKIEERVEDWYISKISWLTRDLRYARQFGHPGQEKIEKEIEAIRARLGMVIQQGMVLE